MARVRPIPTQIALAALVAASVAGAVFGILCISAPAAAQATAPHGHLYLLNDAATKLLPIDPATLVGIKRAPAIRIAPRVGAIPPSVVASPNGSVVVAASYAVYASRGKDVTIRTFNARTGAARGSPFHPATGLWVEGTSPDGSELYGPSLLPSPNFSTTNNYFVVNARNGKLLHRLGPQKVCCGLHADGPTLYDPTSHRLYLLETAGRPAAGHQPATPVLAAFDLRSGKQVRTLSLPGVMAGFWTTDTQSRPGPTIVSWSPGFALSRNGREIAILDGNSNMLTLVDSRTLTITRRLSLSSPRSFWDQLGSLLGVVPDTAVAKEMIGEDLQMHFSADGSTLLVTGSRGERGRKGTYSTIDLGLRAIAVDTGEIKASVLSDRWIMWAEPAPDADSVYALVAGSQGCPCTLDRLDPGTLAVTARRLGLGTLGNMPYIYFLAG